MENVDRVNVENPHMTGELLAFAAFMALMMLLIVWLLRRGARAVEKLDAEIEELRKRPP